MKKLFITTLLVLSTLVSAIGVHAQSTAGRVSFGFDFEGNKLYGNFRDN